MLKKHTIKHLKASAQRLRKMADGGVADKIDPRGSEYFNNRMGESDRDTLNRMSSEAAFPPNWERGDPRSPLARDAGINDIGIDPIHRLLERNRRNGEYADGGMPTEEVASGNPPEGTYDGRLHLNVTPRAPATEEGARNGYEQDLAAKAREVWAKRTRQSVEPEAGRAEGNVAPFLEGIAAGTVPGSGVADYSGQMPDFKGGKHPSFAQNVKEGNYGTAALQGIGALGDTAMAIPAIGPAIGEAAKLPRAVQLALKATAAAKAEREAAAASKLAEVKPPVRAPEMALPAISPSVEGMENIARMDGPLNSNPLEKNLHVADILYGKNHPDVVEPGSSNVFDVAAKLHERGSKALEDMGVPGGRIEAPHPATDEIISRQMAHEVEQAIGSRPKGESANTWYTTKVEQALEIASELHPEIRQNNTARTAYTLALAVTSQGEKVGSNVRLTEIAFDHFKRTGRFPTAINAKNGPAMNANFEKANDLIDKMGEDQFIKFLGTKFTVGELKSAGFDIGGENVNHTVYGSSIFGAKIGGGFFQNLNGRYDPLTMDLWFMRGWGRLTGTLVGAKNEATIAKQRGRFIDALRKNNDPSNLPEGTDLSKIIGNPKEEEALALAINKQHENNYKKFREEYDSGVRDKSEIVKAAERLEYGLHGINETPASGGHRAWMRQRVERARELLKQKGHDLTNADFQAVWWYPEKDLYAKLGAGTEGLNVDYRQALSDLARERGVTPDVIRAAERRVLARYQRRRSAVNDSGGAGSAAGANAEQDPLGQFSPGERNSFLVENSLRDLRESKGVATPTAEGKLPASYRSGTPSGNREQRAGVEKFHAPEISARNTYEGLGAPAEGFNELKPEGAQTFHDALSAARDSQGNYGKAVAVYTPEEYRNSRLFVSPDKNQGFALKGDDIVSVFKNKAAPGTNSTAPLLDLAVQMGGRRLDAFDTVLPDIYSRSGFRAVARTKFNPKFAPEGWDYDTFSKWNKGKPDIVFMVYDPKNPRLYRKGGGTMVKSYDDAVALQQREAEKISSAYGLKEYPQINLRLDIIGSEKKNDIKDALGAIKKLGVKVIDYKQDGNKLVARLSRPLTEAEGNLLSSSLKQEAIAQKMGDRGDLLGPKAKEWGPFDPSRFHEYKRGGAVLTPVDRNPFLRNRADGGEVTEDSITADLARRAAAERVRKAVRHPFADGGMPEADPTGTVAPEGFFDNRLHLNVTPKTDAPEGIRQLAPSPPDQSIMPALQAGFGKVRDFLTPEYFRTPQNQPLPPPGNEGKVPSNQPMGIEAAPMLALDTAGNFSGMGLGKAAMAVGAPIAAKAAKMVRELSPLGLYSHAAEAAAALPQAKGTPQQMRAMLEKAGVKPEELKWANWSALENQPMLTKEQIAQHFRENSPQVKETRLNSVEESEDPLVNQLRRENGRPPQPKFSTYQLPGGENYREVLLHLPDAKATRMQELELMMNRGDKMSLPEREEYYKLAEEKAGSKSFISSHWDEPNVVSHLRMSDRNLPNGEKALHLEELQSDWAQKGRKEGFKVAGNRERANEINKEMDKISNEVGFTEAASDPRFQALSEELNDVSAKNLNGPPAAPYVQNTGAWTDLALKRALREAAEGGHDRLVWTPGEAQAARYDLSTKLDRIEYGNEGNKVRIRAYAKDDPQAILPGVPQTFTERAEIEKYYGKEIADKIYNQAGDELKGRFNSGMRALRDDNLKVGGEGMKAYYNKIVPNQLQKIVKKLDPEAKFEGMKLPAAEGKGEHDSMSLRITPKMREAILKGLPAFSLGGAISMTAVDHNPFAPTRSSGGSVKVNFNRALKRRH